MKHQTQQRMQRYRRAALAIAALGLLAGCHQDMWDQPYQRPLTQNGLFENGMASRPDVAGTVPYDGHRREWWSKETFAPLALAKAELDGVAAPSHPEWVPPHDDTRFYTGKEADGTFVQNNYFPVTKELLLRGKQRFEISCSPCHGYAGYADGYVVSRGFPMPTSYHIDRLREASDGYFFDVITNGFGRMYPYKARVQPEDRWAIIAYIRALQASQNVDLNALPQEDRAQIEEAMKQPEETDVPAEPHGAGGGHGH